MASHKSHCTESGDPVSLYLDLWNLLLIALGVALVLLFRPFGN
jgi:hypothetical protein